MKCEKETRKARKSGTRKGYSFFSTLIRKLGAHLHAPWSQYKQRNTVTSRSISTCFSTRDVSGVCVPQMVASPQTRTLRRLFTHLNASMIEVEAGGSQGGGGMRDEYSVGTPPTRHVRGVGTPSALACTKPGLRRHGTSRSRPCSCW